MTSRLERILSVVLTASAVVIAFGVARRELRGAPPRGRAAIEFVKGWEKALEVGITVGSKSAPVKIVEFVDLQCPSCRRFQPIIRDLLTENSADLAVVYVHLPLPGHFFATPAARAAECAERSGLFYPFIEAVFAKQDSLGIKSWGSFALDAGIADTSYISNCTTSDDPFSRITDGAALAQALEVNGTPTVFVNGYRFASPSKENLVRAMNAVRRGKPANYQGDLKAN